MNQKDLSYMYYPGCSLKATASAYDVSTKRVAEKLGITLTEIEDWNCCGATEYFTLDTIPAYSLVARNLSLAQDNINGTRELVAPCSACYLNLRKTDQNMGKYPKLNQLINQALSAGGLHYQPGSLRVRHLLDILVEDLGYDRIKEAVTMPLYELRVAPYYGCLIVRPETGYNTEYPTHLDELMTTLEATVVDFPVKSHCCGGHMTQISEEVAYELIRRILQNADDYHADAIVTLCPMCQLNLDAYQQEVNRAFNTNFHIPILYFTQLIGLALGLAPDDLGLGSEIVAAQSALNKIGHEEPKQVYHPKKADKQALPMPSSDTEGGRS